MAIQTKNPTTEQVVKTFEELTDSGLEEKLAGAEEAFRSWRQTSFSERTELMQMLARTLKKNARKYGEILTAEMGKPIAAAIAEVEKCAWVCEYYAENAEAMLSEEHIKTEMSESYVRFEPAGTVLAVMPWNFPFWQVFRFAAPVVMAGNVGLLKHASNVPQSALAIEESFLKAGFPTGVFQTLLVGVTKVDDIIRDERVQAVTLTGSEFAGSQVAKTAGEKIKKTVLELGGSDPFIVLEDANIEATCDAAATGRLQNAGQSCIAAKRFIVLAPRFKEFVRELKERFERQVVGDPMDEATKIGPLATKKILTDLETQVADALLKGATLVTGGERYGETGYFYKPTILTDVTPDMRAYNEELFGPVAVVFSVKSAAEAVMLANATTFGLGASVWTQDVRRAKQLVSQIEAGFVSVNQIVKSDPRLPFGGVKKSGYGRELSHYGIKEFTNIKTVTIK